MTVEVRNAATDGVTGRVPVEPDSESAIDAVFVIGTGSRNDNEELRYALRNVERNCPFVRRVYIVGECPAWVNTKEVIHLKWPDRFTHAKDSNITDKLRHACETDGIAKRILFCSDDQFQTRICSWDDFAPVWLREYNKDDSWYEDRKRVWHSRLHRTLEKERLRRLAFGEKEGKIYYWEPHIYSPIDRDLFIQYCRWCDYEHRDDCITQSGYYNYVRQAGSRSQDHMFISAGHDWKNKKTHIAYTDGSFDAAMRYLKTEFPNMSRFELSSGPRRIALPAFTGGASDRHWDRFDFKSVLLCTKYADRAVAVQTEFERAGLHGVIPFWRSPSPYTGVVENSIQHNGTCHGGFLDCVLGHQQMIRAAYDCGSSFAVFFEDDIRFARDIQTLYAALDSLPDDTDVGLFDWVPKSKADDASVAKATSEGPLWRRFTDLRSGAFYCLSRRAMSALLGELERPAAQSGRLKTVDQHFWNILNGDTLHGYHAYPNPAVQADLVSNSRNIGVRYKRIGIDRRNYGVAPIAK